MSRPQQDLVRIDLPAATDHLRLVRLVVAGLATGLGADVDDLEDLRIATGELCAHLMDRSGPDDRLEVEVEADAGTGGGPSVRLIANLRDTTDVDELDELASVVLGTTTDQCGLGTAPWAERATPGASGWFERAVRASSDA